MRSVFCLQSSHRRKSSLTKLYASTIIRNISLSSAVVSETTVDGGLWNVGANRRGFRGGYCVLKEERFLTLESTVSEIIGHLEYVRNPSWKYLRNLESPKVSSPGFGNDSKMMVMFSLQSDSLQTFIWRAPVPVTPKRTLLDDTISVVQPVNRILRLPELRRAAFDEWCNIPQDQIDNLILSMPRHCTDCIASFGDVLCANYHTKPVIHWCAKIKDEVEKLAYQLNEEAERTERPIRRLSKKMYGSTCADIQLDVMGECLSSIKHVVGTTSECFYPRSNHWEKLEEGRSVTSVAEEFGIAHSIVSRLWRQFQTTGTAIRGFSSGRPRGTTPADDRYIVLQARRNRRQTAGEIARHTTQATGRPISRFTVARRLHGGGLFARRPVRCVPLTPAHRRRRSLWCREHRNWKDNEWGRVLFTDESRFFLSSDSHRILIWRERGSRNHPSNIIERDRYGGRDVLVWGGIMLGSHTDLHIFDAGSINGTRYSNEILLPYVRLFRGAMGLQFLFMDDNAPCHRTVAAKQLLESRRLAARTLPPITIRELRLALKDEWAAMPQ
ncbi:transposable element Tcb2 transposase [Trichonephila clavipes]|nr:transposable element Tcb2 transposase [Trichonephila clavipes]